MKTFILKSLIIIIILFNSAEAHARRGCCSWHGGVCGCSENGRQICCDGTLSPSCICRVQIRTEPHTRNMDLNNTISFDNIKPSSNEYCSQWQEIYKTATILKGEYENIKKVEYIGQYKECVDLWQVVSKTPSLSLCNDRSCIIENMTHDWCWKEINKKIENLFQYLVRTHNK